jgi:hypothetical protein
MKKLLLPIVFLALALGLAPSAVLTQPAPTPISPLTGPEQFVLQYAPPSGCSVNCFTTANAIKSFVGGGGGNTVTLTAGTNIAAGSSVSVNSSGHAVQTWGPAPQIAGTATLFGGAASLSNVAALPLGASSFVAANSPAGLQAGSISAGVVSVGAYATDAISAAIAANTYGANDGNFQAAGLTSSSFVAAYNDSGTGHLNVVIGGINGSNAISYGTPEQVVAEPGSFGYYTAIVKLSPTTFVLTYTDGDGAVFAVAGTVSGTSITLGTPLQLTSNGSGSVIVPAGSSGVLVAYQDANNSNLLTVVAASVSVRTLTAGTPRAISGDTNVPGTLTSLTPTLAVLWSIGSNLYAIGISGTSVTVGTPVATTTGAQGSALYPLSSTVAVGWYQTDNFTVSVSGTNLTLTQSAFNFPPGDIGGIGNSTGSYARFYGTAAVGLSGGLAIVCDTNFSIFETTADAVLSQPVNHQFLTGYWLYTLGSTTALATLLDINGVAYARVITANPINGGPIGFSNSAVTSGNSVTVTLPNGTATGLTDQAGDALTPGTTYYHNGDGSIVTANTGHKAGMAQTTSTLLIQNYLLKRDLDPASNDNSPTFMDEAA